MIICDIINDIIQHYILQHLKLDEIQNQLKIMVLILINFEMIEPLEWINNIEHQVHQWIHFLFIINDYVLLGHLGIVH